MKKLLMLLVACSFTLGTIGCGAKPAAKADAKADAKPAKKGLKKMKGNRMEVAEEDE